MKINGYIQTTAPIHITDSTEGNATGIATMPIPDYESGRTSRVPGVKGTVLRGMLRKTADDIANEQMLRHGVKVPMEVFNALRHGSTSGRMTKEPMKASAFDVMRGHPIMGLFGGGPRSSTGMLVTPWMLPLCKETLAANMVPADDRIENPMPAYQLVGEDTMYPKTDVIYKSEAVFEQVIEDFNDKTDEMVAADVGRRMGKDSGEGTESTLRSSNLLTYRFMVPNVLLNLDLSVAKSAPDHVKGFLLVALARALNANRVGGMQRIGMGENAFNLGSVAANVRLDGEKLFDWDGHELTISEDGEAARLKAAFDLWHDDGKAWTVQSLWDATGFTGIDLGVAAVKKTKAPKPPKKGDGAAKAA